MIKLAPSILSADFNILGKQLNIIENSGVEYLHIDVMDGHFVPNISLGIPIIESIRKKSSMVFDVHLMIENPEKYINQFRAVGADIITVHAEACENPVKIIKMIKDTGAKAGLSIKPGTETRVILDNLNEIDLVLVMTVEPGFGGQKFIPETIDKIKEISNKIQLLGLDTELEVDGGINLENVQEVLNAGANVIVAGSAVFNAENLQERVGQFYDVFTNFGGAK